MLPSSPQRILAPAMSTGAVDVFTADLVPMDSKSVEDKTQAQVQAQAHNLGHALGNSVSHPLSRESDTTTARLDALQEVIMDTLTRLDEFTLVVAAMGQQSSTATAASVERLTARALELEEAFAAIDEMQVYVDSVDTVTKQLHVRMGLLEKKHADKLGNSGGSGRKIGSMVSSFFEKGLKTISGGLVEKKNKKKSSPSRGGSALTNRPSEHYVPLTTPARELLVPCFGKETHTLVEEKKKEFEEQ